LYGGKHCIGGEGHDLFRKGISHKKTPLSLGVAENSGSAPLNSWESPLNLPDLEFLATGSEPYGYPLASGPEGATLDGRKMAMAETGGAVNERGSTPTLLNDTNFLINLIFAIFDVNWMAQGGYGTAGRFQKH
jgi:hypothetical protein